MQHLTITKSFDFAHRGCDVVAYEAGQTVETNDKEFVDVALTEGWAKKAKAEPATKAKGAVPENKDAAGDSENPVT